MSDLRITIDGYGVVLVKRPKKRTRRKVDDAIASAVTQTMQLVDPRTPQMRFHPALGLTPRR